MFEVCDVFYVLNVCLFTHCICNTQHLAGTYIVHLWWHLLYKWTSDLFMVTMAT